MPGRILLLTVLGAMHALLGAPRTDAEILPRSGEFEGVYHRDRAGVGRFGYYLVAPELDERLRKFEDRRIQLKVLRLDQPINPGRGMIRAIGEITPLDESPLAFELQTRLRSSKQGKHEIEATFLAANQSTKPIDLSLHDLFLRVYSKQQPDRELPDHFFPDYTKSQLSSREESVQWLNSHLTVAAGSFEYGHHVRIKPGEKFPLVARLPIAAGEHDFKIVGTAFANDERFPAKESWFSITIKVADRLDSPTVAGEKLRLERISWKRTENGWKQPIARLTFTVPRPTHGRSVVACSESKTRTILAGTIVAFTDDEHASPLSIDYCYDCSNLGEPWILAPIPGEGLTASIDLRLDRRVLGWLDVKSLRLELLTDQGLEAFTLDVPDIDLSGVKDARSK